MRATVGSANDWDIGDLRMHSDLPITSAVRTIGLYSFPKSGNTWLRQTLAGAAGERMARAVPGMHRHDAIGNPVSIGGKTFRFYKSHGKTELTSHQNQPLVNDGIIYVLRHPLDVFLSYLNYQSSNVTGSNRFLIPCDNVEDIIARGDLDLYFSVFIAFGTLDPNFGEAGSWFDNVSYWSQRAANDKQVVLIRYEDMHGDVARTLAPVADLLEIDIGELLRGFEIAQNRTQLDGRFFWKQKAGNYRDLIPSSLVERFDKHHGDFVRGLGYTL